MKKALVQRTAPQFTLPAKTGHTRLISGLTLLGLLVGLGLFASRPAHTVGGPVAVAVSNAVQDRDSPARQPVEKYIAVFNSSTYSVGGILFYTVPAGKRLIVQSMTLIGNGGSYVSEVNTTDAPGNVLSYATLSTGVNNGVFPVATQPMQLHVEPGGRIQLGVTEHGDFGVNALISLSGYLVDVP